MEGAPQLAPVERAPKARMTDDEIEKGIEFVLGHNELMREKWESLIEELPPEEQLAKLEQLAKRRREALAPKPYVSERLTLLEHMPADAEVFFKEAMNALEERTQEVDRGMNGRIMEYIGKNKDEPNIVFKMLIRPPIGEQNDLLSEASYLADIHSFAEAKANAELGVGVPRPFYCASASKARIIAMEKVPGVSIENILVEQLPLPKDLDIDEIEHSLLEFVHHMNAVGLFHNDLHRGNIMLNFNPQEGEKPVYIVDMGSAKRIGKHATEGQALDRTRDSVMLKKALTLLRQYKSRQQ